MVTIGSMKCGTSSLHEYLSTHPDLAMAPAKELNFFFGTEPGDVGNHWRGVEWYRRQFPTAGKLRGESSPGYTSPDHPGVAARMAALVPEVRLLYLVRDPLERAVSQYRHHRAEGSERRRIDDALLDPRSHYVCRSRFAARLRPFLDHFPATQVAVVDHRDLHDRPGRVVADACRFLGVPPEVDRQATRRRFNEAAEPRPEVPARLATAFHALIEDDARRFEGLRRRLPAIGAIEERGSSGERGSTSVGRRPDALTREAL